MPKLSAAQLDAWANYWSRYFQDVLDRHRRRKAKESLAAIEAFEQQQRENECEAERRRVERWRRSRAAERGSK